MQCALYDTGYCRSCQWIMQPIPEQLSAKAADLKNLLANFPTEEWCTSVSSPEQGFRDKVEMAVSGSIEKPLLDMLHRDGTPGDLCDYSLYPASFAPVLTALKPFIARVGLTPYNMTRKRGELKCILLTESQSDGDMMLHFIPRSDTKLTQLRKALPWLHEQLPQLKVITVNVQPVHMAIMEEETEICLTEQQALAERFNDVPLWIRPQSFFQTNPAIVNQLYTTACDWVRQLPAKYMWDLFCDMGGSGLHRAAPNIQLTGVEIVPETIVCAKQSATKLGLTCLQFQALDSTWFTAVQGNVPELVLVNPPHRGIGKPLRDCLSTMTPRLIIYFSRNIQAMAKDICELSGFHIERMQLSNMSPYTVYYEVLTLLVKQWKDHMCGFRLLARHALFMPDAV